MYQLSNLSRERTPKVAFLTIASNKHHMSKVDEYFKHIYTINHAIMLLLKIATMLLFIHVKFFKKN